MIRDSDPPTSEKCIHIVATMTNEIGTDHCIQNCPVSTTRTQRPAAPAARVSECGGGAKRNRTPKRIVDQVKLAELTFPLSPDYYEDR